MSITYKITSNIIKFLNVKKMFLKNKEEMLEYAKGENAKVVFDLDKAMKRAKRKNYYLYDRDVMGYRVILYQENQDFAKGFRVIIMTQANSQVNTRVLELLPKFKIKKMNRWCAV